MKKFENRKRRILVVRTDRLGDVVLATPLIRSLKQTFPDAFIAAMVRPYAASILTHNPHLDAIILDDFEGKDKGLRGFLKKIREVKGYRFDTALMLLPTERAAWVLFLAGIRLRIGVGKKIYETLTLTRTVSRNKYNPLRHEADYCMDLGRAVGVKPDDLKPEIVLTEEEKKGGANILRKEGIHFGDLIVGIHPGSGNSSSNWSVETYAQLFCQILENFKVKVVITGSFSESLLAENIHFQAGQGAINLMGKLSLRELIAVINCYDLFISSSTGPMHIAAALHVPTVSLFCRLTACSPKLWGPIGNDHQVITPSDEFCSDCDEKAKCHLEGIEVQQVYGVIEAILRNKLKKK